MADRDIPEEKAWSRANGRFNDKTAATTRRSTALVLGWVTNMAKRKLWATKFAFPGATLTRHESKAAAYRSVQRQAAAWAAQSLRCQHLTVFVDERDGRGYQTYERIDLAELATPHPGGPS